MDNKKVILFSGTGLIAFVMIVVAIIAGLANRVHGDEEDGAVRVHKFQVINPALIDTIYSVEYVAEIQAAQHVDLRARVKGFIEKIHVDEGQTVRMGDVLCTISSQEYQAELLKATAALNSVTAEMKAADVELKSAGALVNKGIVSLYQLELAQAKVDALAAKIEEAKSHQAAARINLSYANIKAPFDGIVGRLPHKTGSFVEESAFLTTISDNSRVYAYFNIPEKEYFNLLSAGDHTIQRPVSLIMANDLQYSLRGKIETANNSIDRATGNISFRASFPNPELWLKHGAAGKVKLEKTLKDVLIIPQVATVESQDKIFVYVVDADNMIRRKNIVPKLRLASTYVVGSGLNVSDRIIYSGIQMVREGDKVDPQLTTFLSPSRKVKLASLAQ